MCLGIPGRVTAIEESGDLLMGRVAFGGVTKRVCLEHVPDVRIGEYVVVHVGFALSRLDEEEALRVFALLRELDQLDELREPDAPPIPLGGTTMKYLDEYRDPEAARRLVEAIRAEVTRPWTIMEVCGGQTHTIVRYGLDEVLPREIELVHGPGCPVCVTSLEMVDRAHAIASRPDVIFTSYGDMLRVPGTRGDLLSLKARGADIRVVYSPLDAVELAARHPDREVCFFAIGFETTAPANAMAVWTAKRRGLANFSALVSHVLVPPVMAALLSSPENRVQAFLGPGHVCTVMGTREYEPIARRFRVPIVVTGFEPLDLLEGVLLAVRQLESGRAEVENAYARSVRAEGNRKALELLAEVFVTGDQKWRGVGSIAESGYRLTEAYAPFDAARRFDVSAIEAEESEVCISGEVLRGLKKPCDCPAFGRECTPRTPLGATMVSSEGACAAYYTYGRHLDAAALTAGTDA